MDSRAVVAGGARVVLSLLLLLLTAFYIIQTEWVGLASLIALPFAGAVLYFLFRDPFHALDLTLILGFVAIGIMRYVPGAPLGLLVDFALAAGLIAALLHPAMKVELARLRNPLVYLSAVWVAYCIAQLANPEAHSLAAWFYAVRGVALYMAFTIPLTLLYCRDSGQVDRFLRITFLLSLAACLWGLKQFLVGLDRSEVAWLDTGPRLTHVLRGELRIFSFFSDAGQFGAGIAHTGVIAAVMSLGPYKTWRRLGLLLLAVLCFYLMVLSGTRGALFVPIAGLLTYLFVSRNFKVLLLGVLLLAGLVAALRFTSVGNDNYQVRRLRSALDFNDASLRVRLDNQLKFKEYLSGRPFGGGIGSAGSWGKRFSPGTFLAETPTDSWYVKIWAETGIVGIAYYIIMLIGFLLLGIRYIWRIKDPALRNKMMALHAGLAGIFLASYGNPILGQMPTGIIVYMSLAFLFLSPYLDRQISLQKNAAP